MPSRADAALSRLKLVLLTYRLAVLIITPFQLGDNFGLSLCESSVVELGPQN